jgi:hypothetical protein
MYIIKKNGGDKLALWSGTSHYYTSAVGCQFDFNPLKKNKKIVMLFWNYNSRKYALSGVPLLLMLFCLFLRFFYWILEPFQ